MRTELKAFLLATPIGALGGLIGLGGAEYRLPVLKVVFSRSTPVAVALNLATSLVTLASALAVRGTVAPPSDLAHWLPVLLGLAAGAMGGAYVGTTYASRLSVERLERWILVLLVAIGLLLIVESIVAFGSSGIPASLSMRVPVAVVLGVGIGLISSLLGVAGGEVIIPVLLLVFGADIKTAGTLSVLISLPTVAVGIWRYARRGLYVGGDLRALVFPMGIGSILGALAGGALVPYAPEQVLKLVLGVILIVSAVMVFRHKPLDSSARSR